jgi:hypothetical protein
MKIQRTRAVALVCALGASSAAIAQTTFVVEVVTKTSAHPYFGMGAFDGYQIDGVEGAVLQLQRGVTYTFQMNGTPVFHPFMMSTSEVGGFPFVGEYLTGVVNSGASGFGTLEFTPDATTPSLLYYQCGNHMFMGYKIEIGSSSCYADCDTSTGVGVLDVFDFLCFQNSFVSGETYACDCDTSTGTLVCDVFDFLCFQDAFVQGCP